MILTTHSMDEADVLCDRIAIVTNGILRCCAPQIRLKNLYGGGYHLEINSHKPYYLYKANKFARRKLRKQKEKLQKQSEAAKRQDIRAHPLQSKAEGSKPDGELETVETINMGQIYGDIKAFVKQLAPRADLITEFNGNFMYLIPTQGFNAA